MVTDEVDRGDQLRQSFEGVVLTLDRNEDRIGRGQCVHRHESERWRAVQQDVVVVVCNGGDEACEAALPLGEWGKLDVGARQSYRGWNDVESLDASWHRNVGEARGVNHRVVDGALDLGLVEPEPAGGVALGVQVDDENALAGEGQICRQVDHRGRLADAAFLVGAGNRLPH